MAIGIVHMSDPYAKLNQTNKGNKMQSMRVVTMSPQGLEQEFVYECHNEATALAIIEGTSKACKGSGWYVKEFQVA